MRIIVATIIAALCSHSAMAAPDRYVLKGSLLSVAINLSTGAIADFQDLRTADSSAVFGSNDSVLRIAAGEYAPIGFSIVSADSASVTMSSSSFQGQSSSLPIRTTIKYSLIGSRLNVDYCFEALERIEMTDGLDVNIASSAWDTLIIRNHFARENAVIFGQANGLRRRALNQVYELRNTRRILSLVFPNPYQSLATISNSGAHSCAFRWHILVATPPPEAVDPKGPALASVLSEGVKLNRQIELVVGHPEQELEGISSPLAYFSPFPNGYDQVIAMTFDDIPFGRWITINKDIDPNKAREEYLLQLLTDHPRMKMGWIILPDAIFSNADLTTPDYPSGQWWLAHGTHRISRYAPEEFKQWLRNIDRDSVVYGYEDRVHLGCHGLHHTPETNFSGFEFQSYNPASDDSTISAIMNEYSLLGLSANSRRWMRFPGFHFSRSVIDALIKHGFVLFDYWGIYTKLPWMLFYSEYGRIWGIGTQWEGDTPSTFQDMDKILSAGWLCHTAGHPVQWFNGDSAQAYEPINKIFQQAEGKYLNLGYMFPDEVGSFANETYDIHDISIEIGADAFVVCFSGAATSGQTLMLEWPDSIPRPTSATVDGVKIPRIEKRGRRIVLKLPALSDGNHIVRTPTSFGDLFAAQPMTPSFVLRQNFPNPFNGGTTIGYELLKTARVKLAVYNVAGERVATLVDETQLLGSYTVKWNGLTGAGRPAASGIYFCRIQAGEHTGVRKLVLLR
ncbi:MAG: T9SS type A sorting domain-containing protein [Candidatus Krumholzibacteria bacterium]|nr:T9SS type A sorting domain-containing protein [Candidatus Krumholzibacteria bacterium]